MISCFLVCFFPPPPNITLFLCTFYIPEDLQECAIHRKNSFFHVFKSLLFVFVFFQTRISAILYLYTRTAVTCASRSAFQRTLFAKRNFFSFLRPARRDQLIPSIPERLVSAAGRCGGMEGKIERVEREERTRFHIYTCIYSML